MVKVTAAQYESRSMNSLSPAAGSMANLHSVWIAHHTKHILYTESQESHIFLLPLFP
jgi:hypothetical protein